MSQELDFSVRMHANGEDFVRDMSAGAAATQRLERVANEAGTGLRQMSGAAREAASAVQGGTVAARENAAANNAATGAVRNQDAALRAHSKAQGEVIRGSGAVRSGFQQLGFQANDVAAQLSTGTSASIIFAQQSGQVVQALQLMSGGMGASSSAVGRFIGLLSGPWGIAVSLGITVLAMFSDELFGTEKQAKATTDALDFQKMSVKELTAAIDEQLETSRKSIASSYAQEEAARAVTQANLNEAISVREKTKAELSAAQAALKINATRAQATGERGDMAAIGLLSTSSKVVNLEDQLKGNDENIAKLKTLSAQRAIPLAKREVEAGFDKVTAAALRFEKAVAVLDERLTGKKADGKTRVIGIEKRRIDDVQYKKEYNKLVGQRIKEQAEASEEKRSRSKSDSSNRQQGREVTAAQASQIGRNAGFQVNSAVRPTWMKQEVKGGASSQERLYNIWLAQGKPKDNPTARPGTSAHEKGNALDIQLGGGVTLASIRKAYADEGVKLNKVLKERGHAHIEWSTSGADKIVREAESLENKAERAAEVLKNFGERSTETIAQMIAQYDRAPRAVDAAEASIRKVNDLITELGGKKPIGFAQMIADAQKLEPLIRQSLRQPILDMIGDQARQIGIGDALVQNDVSRADAIGITYDLMQKMGAESESQLATELAKRGITGDQVRALYNQTDALREQSRELDLIRAKQQDNLALVGDIRNTFRDTVEGVLRGEGVGALGSGVKRIFDAYVGAKADEISETLFGDIFRKEEEKITGVAKVSEAGEKLAILVEQSGKSLAAQVSANVTSLKSFEATILDVIKSIENGGVIGGPSTPQAAVTNALQVGVSPVADAMQSAADGIEQAGEDIVVTATKTTDSVLESVFKAMLEKVFGKDTASQVAVAVAAIFEGIAIGQASSGTAQSLGIKQDKTAAKIGGAIGGVVGSAFGGPAGGKLGAAIGGFVYGTVGGFLKKAKTGSASLGFSDGVFGANGVGGNNKGMQDQSKSLIGEVGSSLSSFADQLGGILSEKAKVSIGYDKKGRVVVDTTGGGRTKGAGVQNFGKNGEAAAQAFATIDALKDGAITGLSAKVADALRSSSDLDRALREALKVDDVEQLLSGFGGASKKVFVDFERQAKDRLRIAAKYGFDLVKLEEMNGKERTKLFESSVEKAVGGLKNLLEDLTSGGRAPGTILDRRNALLTKKSQLEKLAPTDSDAAGKLADVLDQLEKVSVEAFGTAGALYAGDRANIMSTAETIIAQATADLRAAQDAARQSAGTGSSATDALIGTGNGLLAQINAGINEQNNQSAQMLAALGRLGGQNSSLNYGGSAYVAAGFNIGSNLF